MDFLFGLNSDIAYQTRRIAEDTYLPACTLCLWVETFRGGKHLRWGEAIGGWHILAMCPVLTWSDTIRRCPCGEESPDLHCDCIQAGTVPGFCPGRTTQSYLFKLRYPGGFMLCVQSAW